MTEKATKLFNKNFFLLWQGQTVSQIGSQIFSIALMFWIKHQTGSATLMGLIMTISMLPSVLLGPFAGTLSDTFSRKKIIVIADIVSGLNVLILASIVFFELLSLDNTIIAIFILLGMNGISLAVFHPAVTASIPDIVPEEKLQTANSLQQTSYQLSMFIGQAAGGVLFLLFGAPLLFLVDGITYWFSALSESFINIPQKLNKKEKDFKESFSKFKKDSLEGLKYVWNHEGIKFIFLSFAVMTFFIMPVVVLLPFFVEDTLKLQADWYGYIFAGFGFGSILGYSLSSIINPKGKVRVYTTLISLVLTGLGLAVFGLTTNGWMALFVMLGTGIVDGYFSVNVITILQLSVPSEMRGRVFALLNSISGGLAPVAMGLAGVAGDLLDKNIPLIFVICGGLTLLTCVVSAFSKHYREFLNK